MLCTPYPYIGGQNVNKLSTKADVRFNVQGAEWLPEEVRIRFISIWGSRINSDGEVSVQSDKFRTQHQNLQDAMDKLQVMVDKAVELPKERNHSDELSQHTKITRRRDKAIHSEKKQRRSNKDDYY